MPVTEMTMKCNVDHERSRSDWHVMSGGGDYRYQEGKSADAYTTQSRGMDRIDTTRRCTIPQSITTIERNIV